MLQFRSTRVNLKNAVIISRNPKQLKSTEQPASNSPANPRQTCTEAAMLGGFKSLPRYAIT